MNVSQLCNFRKLPRHEKLIEVYKHGQGRWLFATDGKRAVGIKTDVYIGFDAMEDRHSNVANVISGYFSRSFKKLNPQHFMSWLFSVDTCSTCNGDKKITCSVCDGDGGNECEECSGGGMCTVVCDNCDGEGNCIVDCDECDGDCTVEENCDECDGTGNITTECSACDGSGENEEGGSCSTCEGDGEVEKKCQECKNGKCNVECSNCDGEGKVDEDCEECNCGEIEKNCDNCNGDGTIDCKRCDSNCQENCKACNDFGKFFGTVVLDLSLVKDLGMSVFKEISVTDPHEAVVFRGDDIMAIVMPVYSSDEYRSYDGE